MLLKFPETDSITYNKKARLDEYLQRRKVYMEDSETDMEMSEKSYEPLLTVAEVWESIVLINFNLTWLFSTIFANMVLYFCVTFQLVLDYDMIANNSTITLIRVFCDIIIIVDGLALITYLWKRNVYLKTVCRRIDAWAVYIYLLSLISLPLNLFSDYNIYTSISFLFLICLRFCKIYIYIGLMNSSPGQITLSNFFKKYFIIGFITFHTLNCMWLSIGCNEGSEVCDVKFNGSTTYWNSAFFFKKHNRTAHTKLPPFHLYWVSAEFVLGGLTSLGGEGASMKNTNEELISVFIMFAHIWLIFCIFKADIIMVIIHTHAFEGKVVHRLQAMQNDLVLEKGISRAMKRTVVSYYREFFLRDKAVMNATLMGVIPDSFISDAKSEIFWNVIEKCKPLRYRSEAFRRAIMRRMVSETFSRGDVLFDLGQQAKEMCYVARGNLFVLSCENGESPIVTLGQGSLIGQINLVYSKLTKFKIVIATYSVIYTLQKEHLWRIVYRYRKLGEGADIHKSFRRRIKHAHKMQYSKRKEAVTSVVRRWKCLESRKILSVFKEKIRKLAGKASDNNTASFHLYTHSEIQNKKSYDDIFLSTSWPWILRPNSQFVKYWDKCVLLVVCYVGIMFPYYASFKHKDELNSIITTQAVFLVYLFDVLLQMCTAIESKSETLSHISDIVNARMEKMAFITDIIAALPFHLHSLLITPRGISGRVLTFLSLNRLLKLYKIDVSINYFERTTKVPVGAVKIVRCTIYVAYLGYICGALYYSLSCFESVACYNETWVPYLREKMKKAQSEQQQTVKNALDNIWVTSFQDILAVITNESPTITISVIEHIAQCLFSVTGTVVINYLFGEYTAALMLQYKSTMDYLEFFDAIKRLMTHAEMPKQLQTRVFNQLKTSWRVNQGIQRQELYADCPVRLYNMLQVSIYAHLLASSPLFQGIDVEILNLIATRCTSLHLPPGEFLVYSGEQVQNVYIMMKGFCIVLEGSHGKKVLGPDSLISGIEACLGLPSAITVRACTYIKVIKITSKDLKYVAGKYPVFESAIKNSIDEEAVGRVFHKINEYNEVSNIRATDEEEGSFFIFPNSRRHPLNIDYKNAYANTAWKAVRYILLRRTILPYGKFLRNWGMFKGITAFIISFITPAEWVFQFYFPATIYFYYLFYIIGFVDVYIRMHVCYYNCNGVLVTHPRYTAVYYLSHAFIVDILSTLPFPVILQEVAKIQLTKISVLLNFNILLQMYRYPEVFSYTYQLIYKTNDLLHQAVKTVPFMLVAISTFSSLLIYLSSEDSYKDGQFIMIPKNYSWIALANGLDHLDIQEPYVFFFSSFYYNVCIFLGAHFDQYKSWTTAEVVCVNFCLLSGYVFKVYIAVGIAHTRYVGNNKLIAHTNNMVQLLNYLAEEKITKTLQKKVAGHFIQRWNMTYGFPNKAIISSFHFPLKSDFCIHTYLGTLRKVAIFEEASMSFFKHFAYHLDEIYVRKQQDVIRVNDIVDVIYIVHKGEVTIYAPTGEVFATLTEGSMFGNLDNVQCTRSMVCARTSETTDLFVVSTSDFYNLLRQGYTFVYIKLQNFLVLHNLSYIKSIEEIRLTSETAQEYVIRLSFVNKVVSNKFYKFGVIAAGIASCVLSSYQASFEHIHLLHIAIYFLDVVHIVKVVLNFYTPYIDKRGDLVTDLKKIRKRYMKPNKFYLDFLSMVPYEIFCLIKTGKERDLYWKYLGVPRVLRAVNVYQYFSGYDFLSNTVIWIRLLLNLAYTLVLVHIGACLLHVIACPGGECKPNYWIKKEGTIQCGQEYLCSIYMMMSIITLTSYPTTRVPRSLADMAICVITLILSQFSLVVLLADLAVILRNSVYILTEYDFEMNEFLTYLGNSFVSVPFLENMRRYCNNLWMVGKGRQIPTMLLSCPGFLQEEIKIEAYGRHIFDNVVFVNCHPDFLRAVIRELKIQKFFLGDTICHQEDVNDTMYFVHKGIVDVYSETETEEVHVDTLQELDCFGMIQGLFPDTPHTHTFKSNGTCSILFLTYSSWSLLLRFFPASKFEIYSTYLAIHQTCGQDLETK